MPASSNPFADFTVSALLDGVAARYPDREALVLDDERLTFADFRQRSWMPRIRIPAAIA